MAEDEEPIAKKAKLEPSEQGAASSPPPPQALEEAQKTDLKEEDKREEAKMEVKEEKIEPKPEEKDKKEGKEKKDKADGDKKKDKDGKKEKKDKTDGDKVKKEGKDSKEKKDKKDKKDKKEKKDKTDKKEKKEKGEKEKSAEGVKENKEKKDKKEKKVGTEKKDGKDKKDKKEKKDKKDKVENVEKKDKLKKKLGLKVAGAGVAGAAGAKKGEAVKKVGRLGLVGKLKAAVAAKKAATAAPKVLVKTEDDYEPVNRWWDREDGALSGKRGAKKWDTFEHHGLLFAPDYERHNTPIKYEGKEVQLSEEAEEIATFWVSVRGSEYEKKPIFIKNVWSVFKSVLPKDTHIKDFSKCNFDAIAEWREAERQKRLNRPKEEKEAQTKALNKQKEWFSHAIVNGIRERLGAVALEPPQLFRGRGEHPKQGLLKRRTFPEACTINIAEDAAVPKVIGQPGHAWKDVVHDNSVQWIASFEDGLLGETKYVSFAATSGLKGQPDLLKYERARRLLANIDKVRDSYLKLQKSKAVVERQKGVATYFIDQLALRVGGEKDTEEEADTVGCCSLRVEHLKLEPPNLIHFDFLGKDSIQYKNTVEVTDLVYECVSGFMAGKKPTDQVFDRVFPADLNEYFKEFMDDLTAKVFRTYNASYTLQQELDKFDISLKNKMTQDELLKFYNTANRQVAILCNHQKAESKNHATAMEKMQKVKDKMMKELKRYKRHLEELQAGKKPSADKEKAKDSDIKLPKDVMATKKKIMEVKVRLDRHNHAMMLKEENKTVSLGTSKVNYMDPRITVSWCKLVDLQIERVFPRTTRTKFPWAMHFKSTYKFTPLEA